MFNAFLDVIYRFLSFGSNAITILTHNYGGFSLISIISVGGIAALLLWYGISGILG